MKQSTDLGKKNLLGSMAVVLLEWLHEEHFDNFGLNFVC